MTSEDQLKGWTGPSSDTEQEKQDRTERMIKEAVENHDAFEGCQLSVYPKGSYANKTNVRADSDVDIVVQCHEAVYYEEESPGAYKNKTSGYVGLWTPEKLRSELVSALKTKFPNQVDTTGSTAIVVRSSTARVDADVVPCFDFRYYWNSGATREGTKVFKRDSGSLLNYPKQHLVKGNAKDAQTNGSFKRAVRIMKRVENLMVQSEVHREVPSYLVECLVYNCPNEILVRSTWMETIKGIIIHIWNELEGDEPSLPNARWLEVNECKYLFSSSQKWSRTDGRDFSKAAWNYLGFAS